MDVPVPSTRIARKTSWLLFAMLAVGCDRGESAEAKPTAAQAKPTAGDAKTEGEAKGTPAGSDAKANAGTPVAKPDHCDAAYGKTLEAEMQAWCPLNEKVLTIDVPDAPWPSEPAALSRTLLPLEMTKAGVVVGWGPPGPVSGVATRMAEFSRGQSAAVAHGAEPQAGWGLRIAGDVARADVAVLMQALVDAKQPKVELALATPMTGEPPKPRDAALLTELGGRITAKDVGTRTMVLAKEMAGRMPPCPELQESFNSAATVPPEKRCGMLAQGFANGLVQCGCQKEDEVLTLLFGLTLGLEPPTRLGTVAEATLDPAGPSRAGATWAEIVAGLDQAALANLWVAPE
ncbi:MAG: hypothetical protein AAF799_23310 [Myxococcota bacterium]